MSPDRPRLLVLSCSKRKRDNPELMPAIDRYNGPTFNLLRRYLQIIPSARLDVQIISAEFGLIPSSREIQNYDRRMTTERARELATKVTPELDGLIGSGTYGAFCCCVGSTYLNVIPIGGPSWDFGTDISIKYITGGPGRRLSQLYHWLYGAYKVTPSVESNIHTVHLVSFHGEQYALSAGQVYDTVRNALTAKGEHSGNIQTWYVQIDDIRVSPKWLVSSLFGLPVGRFHSDEALRVLRLLGIPVLST